MKKLYIVLLAVVIVLAFVGCSKKAAETADTATSSESEHVAQHINDEPAEQKYDINIDTASLDIDGDGIYEDCSIQYGPTYGIFTIVITASVDGAIKYKNTFIISTDDVSLEEKDGKAQFVCDGKYHRIYVKDNRIVIDKLDSQYEGYWGDSEWNYDLKTR